MHTCSLNQRTACLLFVSPFSPSGTLPTRGLKRVSALFSDSPTITADRRLFVHFWYRGGSGVSRTLLLGWLRWDTKLVWGGQGIAKFNAYTYAADSGSNPGPLLHVKSPLSPMISCLVTVKYKVSMLLKVIFLFHFHLSQSSSISGYFNMSILNQ